MNPIQTSSDRHLRELAESLEAARRGLLKRHPETLSEADLTDLRTIALKLTNIALDLTKLLAQRDDSRRSRE